MHLETNFCLGPNPYVTDRVHFLAQKSGCDRKWTVQRHPRINSHNCIDAMLNNQPQNHQVRFRWKHVQEYSFFSSSPPWPARCCCASASFATGPTSGPATMGDRSKYNWGIRGVWHLQANLYIVNLLIYRIDFWMKPERSVALFSPENDRQNLLLVIVDSGIPCGLPTHVADLPCAQASNIRFDFRRKLVASDVDSLGSHRHLTLSPQSFLPGRTRPRNFDPPSSGNGTQKNDWIWINLLFTLVTGICHC